MSDNVVPFPCHARDAGDPCLHLADLAQHNEAIRNLRAWQGQQNGTLGRLEDKLDGLRNWIMAALLAALLAVLGVSAQLFRVKL